MNKNVKYLEKLKSQKNDLLDEKYKINSKIIKLESRIEQYIVNHKLYETDATEYANKEVRYIKLIVDDKGERYYIQTFTNGKIDKNGHLDVYEFGDMWHDGYRWDNEKQSYVINDCFGNSGTKVNIVGFFDLEIME